MLPYDLHYIWPQALYLSLFILAFFLLYSKYDYDRQHKQALFRPALITPYTKGLYWLHAGLLFASWILATIALMQPVASGHYLEGTLTASQPVEKLLPKRKAHDVILLIDASASMGVMDSRLGKSRLDYAKEIGDQIAASLTGENAALYSFTSKVEELSPLTPDSFFVRMMLAQIDINQGGQAGTNLFEALSTIRKMYLGEPTPKLKTLILISDGADTLIEGLPENEKQKAIDRLANLFLDAEKMHLRVFTIGMGTEAGAIIPDVQYQGQAVTGKLQAHLLQKLAKVGQGNYYQANDYSALGLADNLHRQMLQDPPYYDQKEGLLAGSLLQAILGDSQIVYERYFYYPLGFAIVLLLLAWLMPTSTVRHKKASS